MSFTDFDFSDTLLDALHYMGFKQPTPIQTEAIPIIQDGDDIIACAQTGTGKTAAFLLPILDKLFRADSRKEGVNTLIVCPTRELALQIDQAVEGFGYLLDVNSLPVYGGGDNSTYQQQKKALSQGADIIIATPGRLISHINLGYVNLKNVEHFILDEADRMLDMGFFEDITKIQSFLPKERQNLLFSATFPPKIRDLAKKILVNPKQVNIAISKPAKGVTQGAFLAYDEQKVPIIQHILAQKDYPSVIIFSSTKRMVREIANNLRRKKFEVAEISSDLEQKEREQALLAFRAKKIQILVATDIIARGIDIKEISLVINYAVPNDEADYVHRIGRTARADSTGEAITLINPKDIRQFAAIEKFIEQEVEKRENPEHIGRGPSYDPRRNSRGGSGGGRGGRNSGGRGGNRNRGGHGGNRSNGGRGRNQSNNRGGNRNNGPKRNGSGQGDNRNSGGNRNSGQNRNSGGNSEKSNRGSDNNNRN